MTKGFLWNVAVFTEAKITNDMYPHSAYGYDILATTATAHYLGGVALVWRNTAVSLVESVNRHGPNVISCELVSGSKRWLLVGAYVAPSESNLETMQHVAALQNRRPNLPLILLGDFNVDLRRQTAVDRREAGIFAAIANLGVEDMAPHFLQKYIHQGGWTFAKKVNSRFIRGRCDYILTDDGRQFQRVNIVNVRNYCIDHAAVIGSLIVGNPTDHRQYMKGRKAFPLHIRRGEGNEADRLLGKLHKGLRAEPPVRPPYVSWISEQTWVLFDRRTSGRRDGSLQGQDRRRRAEAAGEAIQTAIEAKDVKKAWDILKRWYRHSTGRFPSRRGLTWECWNRNMRPYVGQHPHQGILFQFTAIKIQFWMGLPAN
jgi:hypothetical protein